MFFAADKRAKLEKQSLYWWEPSDKRINVGDYLSKVIVSEVLSLRDLEIQDKKDKSKRLFAIGSILHFAKSKECVWGSGVNWKLDSAMHRFTGLDVRAVRGPLTRDYLIRRAISVPEIYGDPALLMPLFFPADLLRSEARGSVPYLVIPHLHEPAEKFGAYGEHVLLPTCKPAKFVAELLRARLVISSSLHGIILAEAYGIPALYLEMGNGESRLKYDDYYYGTGRMTYHTASSVEEGIEMGGNSAFDLSRIQQGLLGAFPWDQWG
ncbi:MAG: polysaccharide pyruvyl transferase family protein [Gammaproteobacteria bacterium]|nr:polysaccharide pyruvyl transferase family protein [Gammaproteobacteria bacterium]